MVRGCNRSGRRNRYDRCYRLFDNINVGLVMGLLQFVTTFSVTYAYIRYAARVLDPRSARIREEMEAEGLL